MTQTSSSDAVLPGEPDPSLVDSSRPKAARASIAIAIGTAIEWYDYALYSFVAGLVIAPLFFSAATPQIGLLAAFATFSVGFVARPIGGIVLGALADRLGRRPILIVSVLLIGLVTTLIGALPTYAAIGIWAPILLVTLRFIQGFAAGAELAGAITMSNETAQRIRKGFFSSLAIVGAGVGGLLALIIFTILSNTTSPRDFLAWGWRIPFLFSAVLTVIGAVLRRRLPESPEFEAVQRERATGVLRGARVNPLLAFARAFAASPRNWFAAFLIPSGLNVAGYMVAAFAPAYLVGTVKLPLNQVLFVSLSYSIATIVFAPTFGALSDRIGAKRVMYISVFGSILWAVPYFLMISTGQLPIVILATAISVAFGFGAGSAAHAVLMPAYFKAEFRSSGLFSARELQGALIAGTTPLIATAIVAATGGSYLGPVGMIVVASTLTLIGVLIAKPWVNSAERVATPALAGITPRAG